MSKVKYIGYHSLPNRKTGEMELESIDIGGFSEKSKALQDGMRMMQTENEKDISVSFYEKKSVWYWRPTDRKLWAEVIERFVK